LNVQKCTKKEPDRLLLKFAGQDRRASWYAKIEE
jgi:hypothetical protein